MGYLTQGGVAAIIVYIVLKELFPFLTKMRVGTSGNGNGTFHLKRNDDVEYGRLIQKVEGLDEAVAEMSKVVVKTQETVSILSGNVSMITTLLQNRQRGHD